MKNPRKVLIIKTGFSEFLDRGISTTVSLGDVLFCTAILHLFKQDQVTWITAFQARELLKNNPYITEVLIFGPKVLGQIRDREFDVIINLEKDIGICALVSQIRAKRHYGFYFNDRSHQISTYKKATRYLLSGQENQRAIDKNFFEILYETIEKEWKGQGAVLAAPPRKEKFAVGFNHSVGTKWPTKAWPMEQWKKLEQLLVDDYSISWQQGFSNLKKYTDWINSCRVIVTSDSLGQILGQALGKQIVGLYGPTDHRRLRGVPNIHTIPSGLECPYKPCYLLACKHSQFCMDYISPEEVALACRKILKGSVHP